MEAAIRRNYNAHLDAKRRLTLRGASHEYYNVKEFYNGPKNLDQHFIF